MKILFLPNWKVEYCKKVPIDKQPPDYYVSGNDYWFFRYFENKPDVDIIDISSCKWLESFEKNRIRFYIWQAVKAIPKLRKYDLIISHGMQSGVVVSLWRRLFKGKNKHLVFDIGAFNSAAETGMALKLMQFASRSIDGVIYHTGSQRDYYKKFYPWIMNRCQFIRFGTDPDFFTDSMRDNRFLSDKKYCICVGYSKRDWDTVVKAFAEVQDKDLYLVMVGHVEEKYSAVSRVIQLDRVPVSELIDMISGSKFGILPLESFNYSYGQMTLMQQMSLKKCVITARVPSMVDYVSDGVNAVFYEPCNSDDLRDKIDMINGDDKMRKAIEIAAREFIEHECNEECMAREIEKYISEKFK